MSDRKPLSIVIVNWNTKTMLKHCLESIANTHSMNLVEIYVVDNKSIDGSPEMVERNFPFVKLIRSPGNIGFGRANNLVKSFIQTPFVLFLNPDTIMMEGAIDGMLDFMAHHPKVALLGCLMRNLDGKPQDLGLQWFPSPAKEFIRSLLITGKQLKILKKLLPYSDPTISQYVRKLYGGCLMARCEAIDKVDWFDERYFMYCEDVDLSQQMKLLGWDLYYLAEAEIIHLGGGASENAGSDFATLMKAASVEKLMDKYYGAQGQRLYRISVFIAASIRWYILFFLSLVGLLTRGSRMQFYKRASNKYRALILWSMNLKHAIIK